MVLEEVSSRAACQEAASTGPCSQLQCPVKGRRPQNEAGVVSGGYGVGFHRSGSSGRTSARAGGAS